MIRLIPPTRARPADLAELPVPRVGPRQQPLALALTVAAPVMFAFAASGRELRRFNEIALGLVFLAAALICQFTAITNTRIGR